MQKQGYTDTDGVHFVSSANKPGLPPLLNGPGNYYVRELSKMDPATLVVETVKTLKTLATDGGGLSTIDVDRQTMYWVSALWTDDGSGVNGT